MTTTVFVQLQKNRTEIEIFEAIGKYYYFLATKNILALCCPPFDCDKGDTISLINDFVAGTQFDKKINFLETERSINFQLEV